MRFTFKVSNIARLSLLFALIWIALGSAAVFGWRRLSDEVGRRADAEATIAVSAVSERVRLADKDFGAATKVEVQSLRRAAAVRGPARLVRATGQGAPVLYFGRKPATIGTGGAANAVFVYDKGAFVPAEAAATNLGPIAANSGFPDLLRSGKPAAGPIGLNGRAYYAALAPIAAPGGAVLGVYATLHPLESLDQVLKDRFASSIFARGFLIVADQRGKVLLGSVDRSQSWLTRHLGMIDQGADQQAAILDGYVITRSLVSGTGLRVIAGVNQLNLAQQSLRLVGASLSIMAIVVVVALCLGWLLARRLTEALAEAERSRTEAEKARGVAVTASATLYGELQQAARYVESLLPARVTEGKVTADWLYRPSVGVGGDAFGYLWLDETRFAFYLLDVCGHGVGAALLATTVMNVIRSQTVVADFTDPSSVLAALNDAFPMDRQNGMYFTLWYGVYDTEAQSVCYAAGGHHPAVLLAPGEPPAFLRGRGAPIGCFEHVVFPSFDLDAPSGAQIYIFSDGLFEVELKSESSMMTYEDFVDIIIDWRQEHSNHDLTFILERVQQVQGKTIFDDDCALVEISFRAADAAVAAA